MEPTVSDKTTVELLDYISAAILKQRASYVERLISASRDDHDRICGAIAGLERSLNIITEQRRDFIDGTIYDEDGKDEVRVHVI